MGELRYLTADREHCKGQHQRSNPVAQDRQHLTDVQEPKLRLLSKHAGHPQRPPGRRG